MRMIKLSFFYRRKLQRGEKLLGHRKGSCVFMHRIKLSFFYRRKLQRDENLMSHHEKRLMHCHAYDQTFFLFQAEDAAGWEAAEPLWENAHALSCIQSNSLTSTGGSCSWVRSRWATMRKRSCVFMRMIKYCFFYTWKLQLGEKLLIHYEKRLMHCREND